MCYAVVKQIPNIYKADNFFIMAIKILKSHSLKSAQQVLRKWMAISILYGPCITSMYWDPFASHINELVNKQRGTMFHAAISDICTKLILEIYNF